MKRSIFLISALFVLVWALPVFGQEDNSQLGIALGLRSNYFRLTESRGTIFRSIRALDEDQNYIPMPMIQVALSKYFALELGYSQFKAMTLNVDYVRAFSDGDVEWKPFMLALQFRWPHFHHSVVPYVLGGISYTQTSWNRRDWYYYGFPSPAEYNDWVRQGLNPADLPSGYRRIFDIDDHVIGTVLGLGVDYFLTKHWALNLDWRYHWAKVNFTYTLAFDRGRDVVARDQGTFILDSWILGLGVKYFF